MAYIYMYIYIYICIQIHVCMYTHAISFLYVEHIPSPSYLPPCSRRRSKPFASPGKTSSLRRDFNVDLIMGMWDMYGYLINLIWDIWNHGCIVVLVHRYISSSAKKWGQ